VVVVHKSREREGVERHREESNQDKKYENEGED